MTHPPSIEAAWDLALRVAEALELWPHPLSTCTDLHAESLTCEHPDDLTPAARQQWHHICAWLTITRGWRGEVPDVLAEKAAQVVARLEVWRLTNRHRQVEIETHLTAIRAAHHIGDEVLLVHRLAGAEHLLGPPETGSDPETPA